MMMVVMHVVVVMACIFNDVCECGSNDAGDGCCGTGDTGGSHCDGVLGLSMIVVVFAVMLTASELM